MGRMGSFDENAESSDQFFDQVEYIQSQLKKITRITKEIETKHRKALSSIYADESARK